MKNKILPYLVLAFGLALACTSDQQAESETLKNGLIEAGQKYSEVLDADLSEYDYVYNIGGMSYIGAVISNGSRVGVNEDGHIQFDIRHKLTGEQISIVMFELLEDLGKENIKIRVYFKSGDSEDLNFTLD